MYVTINKVGESQSQSHQQLDHDTQCQSRVITFDDFPTILNLKL